MEVVVTLNKLIEYARMPKIIALVNWAGPFGGIAVAIAFMLAFFSVFWLRSGRRKCRMRNNRGLNACMS